MKKETINTWNEEKVELKISSDGFCYCPVCGEKAINKEWRPYDENGHPSYDICNCGFEYGFDDSGEHPYEKSWERYRTNWLDGKIENGIFKKLTLIQKKEQLLNIGIDINKEKGII